MMSKEAGGYMTVFTLWLFINLYTEDFCTVPNVCYNLTKGSIRKRSNTALQSKVTVDGIKGTEGPCFQVCFRGFRWPVCGCLHFEDGQQLQGQE